MKPEEADKKEQMKDLRNESDELKKIRRRPQQRG